MRVLLVRHGDAVDRHVAGSDADRWLTEEGRRQVSAVGRALDEMGLVYTRVLTSPLVRAVQTAERLTASQTSYRGAIAAHRALASDEGTTAQALALLDDATDDDVVAMITHVPKVGVLATHLGELPRTPSFETASVCLIEVEQGRGRAIWMLDPDTLSVRGF